MLKNNYKISSSYYLYFEEDLQEPCSFIKRNKPALFLPLSVIFIFEIVILRRFFSSYFFHKILQRMKTLSQNIHHQSSFKIRTALDTPSSVHLRKKILFHYLPYQIKVISCSQIFKFLPFSLE